MACADGTFIASNLFTPSRCVYMYAWCYRARRQGARHPKRDKRGAFVEDGFINPPKMSPFSWLGPFTLKMVWFHSLLWMGSFVLDMLLYYKRDFERENA